MMILTLFLCLASCGKSKKSDKTDNKEKENEEKTSISITEKDRIYSMFEEEEDFPLQEYEGMINRILLSDRNVYFTTGEDTWNQEVKHFYVTGISGGKAKEISLPGEYETIKIFNVLENNDSVWAVVYVIDPAASAEEYQLWKIEQEGISERKTVPQGLFSDYMALVLDNKDNLYILNSDGSIDVFTGGETVKVEAAKSGFTGIARNGEGKIFALIGGTLRVKECYVSEIDTESFKTKDGIQILGISYSAGMLNGSGAYDFYIGTSDSLIGYKYRDRYAERVVDFVSSGFGVLLQASTLPDENTILSSECRDQWIVEKYVRIPADVYEGKQEIKMAMFNGTEKSMGSMVKKFNKENSDYYITVTDYSSFWPNESEKLGLDIAAGSYYDLYLMCEGGVSGNDALSYYNFVSKDAFEDLSYFYDSCGIEFVPEVLENIETGGKKYLLPASFSYRTYYGSKDKLSGLASVKINDYLELLGSYTEGPLSWGSVYSADNLFCELAMNYIYENIDLLSGKNSIDEDIIARILDFSKEHAATANGEGEEKALIKGIYDYRIVNNWDDRDFMDGKMFVGLPSEKGSGIHMKVSECLSLSKESDKKEGAYQFFKFILDDSIYESWSRFGLPITMSLYEKQKETCSKEYIEVFERLRKECDGISISDPAMEQVVYGEMREFFAGEVSSSECAKHIVDKLTIFVSERS